ncbi:LuxR C-terminal-related transcriptional regulator [Pseudomonas sp. RC10]|uniref:helix-turn-helix transcriptional regulator n=1 Tax=Pseudomonas bambusae TaxID=3139142 RepID=UPI00313958C6
MLKTLTDCGDVVLNINTSAFEADAEVFQEQVLNQIDQVIGFDRAWWGIMSPTAAGFTLLSSYQANLPDSYVEKWQTCTGDDRLAMSVNDAPTRTVRFGTQELHSTEGLYEINADVGNKYALCTAYRLPGRDDDFLFLSLFRCGRSAAFDKSDVWAKQFLMPHVNLAWRHNLSRRQDHYAGAADASTVMSCVFVDLQFAVLDPPPRFRELVRSVWPHWCGPTLPEPLIQGLLNVPRGSAVRFARLGFTLKPAGGLSLLSISAVSALDSLTPRESQVAAAFACGQSYKEIARSLGLSPATVRHYLREIYAKLGLTDKVELANLVHHAPGRAEP